MTKKEIVLKKPDGLNAANAASLVQLACQYSASIMIRRGSVFINAKSVIGVLSLGAAPGTTLTFEADGADERRAIRALTEFMSA